MHRAELVMQAVMAAVQSLPTTGANVERGRVYPLRGNTTAALSVYQGADTPLTEQTWPLHDSTLTVYLDAHVKEHVSTVETTLNQIRAEATIAMHAHAWPEWVLHVEERGTDEPGIDGAGEKPVGNVRLIWHIRYRRSHDDPTR